MESVQSFTFLTPKPTKKRKCFEFCIEEGEDYTKLATVKIYKKKVVIDIRIHEVEENQLKPTKKGVSLDYEGWLRLIECAKDLQNAHDAKNTEAKFWLNSDTEKAQPVHIFAEICVSARGNHNYCLSSYSQPDPSKLEVKPSGKSICLKQNQFEKLLEFAFDIECAVVQLGED